MTVVQAGTTPQASARSSCRSRRAGSSASAARRRPLAAASGPPDPWPAVWAGTRPMGSGVAWAIRAAVAGATPSTMSRRISSSRARSSWR
ncbi:MAG: hypothetical protein ABSB76_03570 [Streptosporangiaceae bacterium]